MLAHSQPLVRAMSPLLRLPDPSSSVCAYGPTSALSVSRGGLVCDSSEAYFSQVQEVVRAF